MNDLVITVDSLSKVYSRGHQSKKVLPGPLGNLPLVGRRTVATDSFHALRDLSFEVRRGDRIGIVGRNGAGKSTLLKILSRVIVPTTGEIRIRGRLTSLLEVGTGFEKEATGRHNIYLNAGLYGLSRKDIEARFESIVSFSGVGDFLDTPVKHYSSGMYMRLAFSIAAHLDPDILLLDEVLAVGDMAFQQKCLAKIEDITQNNERTILFVSHSLGHVAQYCNKVLWLHDGQIRFFGDLQAGLQLYSEFMAPKTAGSLQDRSDRSGTGRARITGLRLENGKDGVCDGLHTGAPAELVVDWEAYDIKPHEGERVFINVIFENEKKQRIFGTPSDVVDSRVCIANGSGRYRCRIPRLPLLPGVYACTAGLMIDGQLVDKLADAMTIMVLDGDYHGTGRLQVKQFGDFVTDYNWTQDDLPADASQPAAAAGS
ncbi:MAG: ABC transporter ATP-binding protein [Magnetospirillum sp.]|nr:ABC transporter ATP-binding protein [Magnetospirillum sp.]